MDKPILKNDILLSFYGDDFTGSTDVLETLALNGIPAVLFLNAPEKHEVDEFRLKAGIGCSGNSNRVKAFGVAGVSRSLTTSEMDVELPPIFQKIRDIPSDYFHYKICSTFDSSLSTGNIGHAVELALRYFPARYIPLLVGAPFLNRFVVFGNLFARVGEVTYRLDRHPTMSKHPVTPMTESDLRVHLGQQTHRPIKLMDQFCLEGAYGDPTEFLESIIDDSPSYVLYDTLSLDHLNTIGKILVNNHHRDLSLLVGSSSIEYALALYLQQQGRINKVAATINVGKASKMVVMAGSAAPGTAHQIDHMIEEGHKGIRIETCRLAEQEHRSNEIKTVVDEALEVIANNQVPVIYSAIGPDDPEVPKTLEYMESKGIPSKEVGRIIAETQGQILKQIITRIGQLRVAVAGGDTSGYVSRALGIYALETLCPIAPGAPLCVAHSSEPQFDGLEIALKGGQNGNKSYFESILEGTSLN
jgi:uncharacterized protein YgbK (DUF1537 family)